jgi:fimbrial chaperone protein
MPEKRINRSWCNLFENRSLRLSCALWILGLMWLEPVSAGIFSVTPVRIYMSASDRASAVTVTNDGDEEMVMQSDIYDWKQSADGKDILTLSENMILSPPILKIAPRSHQVLRLISLTARNKDLQQTYRMIIRQVPEAKPIKESMQLQIAYAFSIPIFITPPDASAKLDCVLVKAESDATQAICQNVGNATAHTAALHISNASGESLARHDASTYILPGNQKSFLFKESHSEISLGMHRLVIVLNDGTRRSYDISTSE